MANERVYQLTAESLKAFEEELEFLKTTKAQDIAEKLKEARSHGDLSENSEYDEAKNEQAQVASRIQELEDILKYAVVIDESELTTDVVKLGVKVKLLNVDAGNEMEYHIVGSTEANPLKGSISDECPVGRALLGKKLGDVAEVETPGGLLHYKVINISRFR